MWVLNRHDKFASRWFGNWIITGSYAACIGIALIKRISISELDEANSFSLKEKYDCKQIPDISFSAFQYKLLYTISNNIEVYEEPVSRTKKIPHRAVEFMAGEENRTVYDSLYCWGGRLAVWF